MCQHKTISPCNPYINKMKKSNNIIILIDDEKDPLFNDIQNCSVTKTLSKLEIEEKFPT